MNAANETSKQLWLGCIASTGGIAAIGTLWFLGYSTAALMALVAICYFDVGRRIARAEEERRSDGRAYDERAEARHQQLMRALQVLHDQNS